MNIKTMLGIAALFLITACVLAITPIATADTYKIGVKQGDTQLVMAMDGYPAKFNSPTSPSESISPSIELGWKSFWLRTGCASDQGSTTCLISLKHYGQTLPFAFNREYRF